MQSRLKRAGAATVAAAATVALAAGLTSPAVAAPAAPATSAGAAAAKAGTTKGTTRIALITGDRVLVDAKGRPYGIERAKGREGVPVSVQRVDGHVRVVPYDAQRLIDAGKLDARLFDITELARPEYRRARHGGLQLIVQYEGAGGDAKTELHRTKGSTVRRTLGALNAEAVTTAQRGSTAVWNALTRAQSGSASRTTAAGIARVWLDGIRTASLDRSTRQIGADKAWAAGYDGKGVKIAVLDTGVDATHPDLKGKVVAQRNFSLAADVTDHFGHGTHVASIAAGTGAASGGKFRGVAPGATLLNGKVLDDGGSGDDSGIIAGMEWAVAQGADVINLSLGGADQPGIDPMEATVNRLSKEKGVLFAIAAGNAGAPGSVGSPGSAEAALTVGAVDDHDKLADFSSRGPRVGDGAIKPDVTAPGVDITAAAAPGSVIEKEVGQEPKGYLTISGTSMATPHVAGAAALLKQQHPTWKGADLKGVLTASTKPGAYTAFEQGSGRIAVDKALHQKVVAEPVSVGFAKQEWPHTDDKPVTKKVTYRNLTGAPVTLALSVATARPDGKPAPAGFFTLGAKRVTVPAHGTAAVGLTADTRLGGTRDGAYSAYVTATGGGQSVRTAAAVEREVESYDLTLKFVGRDGKPATDYFSSLAGISGLGSGTWLSPFDASGTASLRVPKGRYVLDSGIANDPKDATKGVSAVARPRLDVTKDTAVTLDARTAKPVVITVPARTATTEFAAPSYTVTDRDGGTGFGWWLNSYDGFYTAHAGPAITDGSLVQQFDTHWSYGSQEEYHAALGGKTERLATGYVRRFKDKDLATVKVTVGVDNPGKESGLTAFGMIPGGGGSSGTTFTRKLPTTVTLHLAAREAAWQINAEQYGGRDEQGFPIMEATYSGQTVEYKAGHSYRETFNTGVFGPALGPDLGISRKGNTLSGYLPILADGAGHAGGSLLTRARTVLYRDGAEIGRKDEPLGDPFKVPAGDAAYKLTSTVERDPAVSRTSTKVVASWTFRSAKTADATQLPASVVRFTPRVALDGTSPAGRTVTVPVTVQGSAAGRNLGSLTVWYSYDDGRSWQKLPVRNGAVSVANPGKGGAVSFRATAVDKQGNRHEVTILRAYYAG
ncbi:S8 family peptidase [Streptomyces sp. NPDC093225]|uniref:S8 family peptidase n=1 Tax=Streptomyces sp. NPDC093225 TaxID=3366034 RepID=UPI0038218322